MRIAKTLSKISLQNSDGQIRELGSYWCDQPVVLVFIRHFG